MSVNKKSGFIQKILDDVKTTIKNGHWKVIMVGHDAENNMPSYAYSVGFTTTLKHPEVVISGLPPELSRQLINDIGEKIRKGELFGAGDISSEVIKSFPVRFGGVSPKSKASYFGVAKSFYTDDKFDMVQMQWPDADGVLPKSSTDGQFIYGAVAKSH